MNLIPNHPSAPVNGGGLPHESVPVSKLESGARAKYERSNIIHKFFWRPKPIVFVMAFETLISQALSRRLVKNHSFGFTARQVFSKSWPPG